MGLRSSWRNIKDGPRLDLGRVFSAIRVPWRSANANQPQKLWFGFGYPFNDPASSPRMK